MIRNALAACFAVLVLAACAHTAADSSIEPGGSSLLVERVQDYGSQHDVPAGFQHLIDWHAGTQPVVLLLAAGGQRACAITPVEATRVFRGRPYRCRWSATR